MGNFRKAPTPLNTEPVPGIRRLQSVAESTPTKCYRLQGVLVVPHFLAKGVYVHPNGKHYTAWELEMKGAEACTEVLWNRP